MNISFSLVVYNPDESVLLECLSSLQESIHHARQVYPDLALTLYVVDNSLNANQSIQLEKRIRQSLDLNEQFVLDFIVSPINGGYGHANNLALNRVSSVYHVVMNPDVYLQSESLLLALQYLEAHPQASLLTPSVSGLSGERHYLCKRHPTLWIMFLRSFAPKLIKRLFAKQLFRYEMRDCDYDQVITDVQFPSGCLMFLRTHVLSIVNGFDERFFMYFEDADLGRRIARHGEIHYVPSVRVVHKWERGTHHSPRLRWATIISAFKYWRKWGGMF